MAEFKGTKQGATDICKTASLAPGPKKPRPPKSGVAKEQGNKFELQIDQAKLSEEVR